MTKLADRDQDLPWFSRKTPTARANAAYEVSGGTRNKMYSSRNLSNMGTSDNLSPKVRGGKGSSFEGVDCDMVMSKLLWAFEGKVLLIKVHTRREVREAEQRYEN